MRYLLILLLFIYFSPVFAVEDDCEEPKGPLFNIMKVLCDPRVVCKKQKCKPKIIYRDKPCEDKEVKPQGGNAFSKVGFVKNHDGDTVTFNLNGVHEFFGKDAAVRIKGIDTPELHSRNPCEKELAQRAKEYVTNRLSNANYIDLKDCDKGKYFRMVCEVKVNGRYLSRELLKKSYAVPYDGGTKPKTDWCKIKSQN